MLTDETRILRDDTRIPGESWARRISVKKVLCIEWLGQIVASICWICSVLAYGIQSSGDWLQLCAASAWLLATLASAIDAKVD
jgi:hypothetical protein